MRGGARGQIGHREHIGRFARRPIDYFTWGGVGEAETYDDSSILKLVFIVSKTYTALCIEYNIILGSYYVNAILMIIQTKIE